MRYTEAALEAAVKLAERHLREHRLPGQRGGRDRRGGSGAAPAPLPSDGKTEDSAGARRRAKEAPRR